MLYIISFFLATIASAPFAYAQSQLLETVKDNRRYKKPSVAKKEKRLRAERTRLREQRKRQRAK